MPAMTHVLDELAWRGLLHQTTGGDELRDHLATPGRVAYGGFDPTGTSLTIGNLIPIMLLAHLQRCGHTPIILMGGGTGLIGDPSGKDTERKLLSEDEVAANIAGQLRVFSRVLAMEGEHAAIVVNNATWLTSLGFIEVLRDVGKHFSVNAMIQKDSVRERLEHREQGISYTEFSYMLLQAYDFLHLRREHNCTIQIAGSDQYGNIVAGIDLIRRDMVDASEDQPRGWGVTAPLVTRADGQKIGKTEEGAIWLTADRTSPWAFHQFWLNVADEDAGDFLRWFTFLEQAQVEALEAAHAKSPQDRPMQYRLADELTGMIHGDEQLKRCNEAAAALFGGDIAALDGDMLDEVFSEVPASEHDRGSLGAEAASLVELLPQTTLAASKREAREFLQTGAIAINGVRVDGDLAMERVLCSDDLLHDRTILLRRGKKAWHATRWG